MIDVIFEELKRRELLIKAIDAIIFSKFEYSETGHLRRGVVQQEILNTLGIKKNNMLCTLINERMRLKGYKTVINTGNNRYTNITRRN